MASERYIENNLIRNIDQLGYPAYSPFIRNCRVGLGFGVVDLVLFPMHEPHLVVLIEAKRSIAADADSKVIGQILLYYAGAQQWGLCGVRHFEAFARNPANRKKVRSRNRKSLKMLTGGITPPDAAWQEMQKGRKIKPDQIALFIALDAPPADGLQSALKVLALQHGLTINVASVLALNEVIVWDPTGK